MHIYITEFMMLTVHDVRVERLPLWTTLRANEFSIIGYQWATFPRSSLDSVVLFPAAYIVLRLEHVSHKARSIRNPMLYHYATSMAQKVKESNAKK